jgi:anoctamin-1
LAPLIVLLICLFDLRIDAKRMIWLLKRPVGFKAQNIGSWFKICRFLNAIGIITNGLVIAFTTNWSKSYLLNDSYQNRLVFVLSFEVTLFLFNNFIFFKV